MKIAPFTVRFYKRSRKFNTPSNFPQEIGINFSKPFPMFRDIMMDFINLIYENNEIIRYPDPGGNHIYRSILAKLINLIIGSDIFCAKDLILTNGSSEGIETTCHYIKHIGLSATLPIPGYFKYQYLAEICRIPTSGYYNSIGRVLNTGPKDVPTCIFINNPEAISGKFQSADFYRQLITELENDVTFFLYDLCYLMLDFDPNISTKDFLINVAHKNNLVNSAIVLSASKDLSLPALRSGLLVSKNNELLKTAKNLIMERYFSINAFSSLTMIAYLTMCALWYKRDSGLNKTFKEISYILSYHNLLLPSLSIDLVTAFLDFFSRQLRTIQTNFANVYENFDDLFNFQNSTLPQSGFSALFALNWANPGIMAINEMIDKISRTHQINVYFSYLFSGTPYIWNFLYPNQIHIRINTSIEKERLFSWLENLRFGFKELIKNDRRWKYYV